MTLHPKREGIMLCYPFEEKRLEKWGTIVIVQPKLDGVRCRATWGEEGWRLWSSQMREIVAVPHINESLTAHIPPDLRHLELDGELYIHGESFEEIVSRTSRTVELHPSFHEVQFHVFDTINMRTQAERLGYLPKLDEVVPELHMVPMRIVSDLKGIMAYYEKLVGEGYEGIIVRHPLAPYIRRRSTMIMKFKPKKEDVYEIIGWKEEHSIEGRAKGTLGAFVCRGDDGTPFAVGTGFTANQRKDLWRRKEELVGSFVKVQYQHITPGKGVPRFPVFTEVIEKTWGEEE